MTMGLRGVVAVFLASGCVIAATPSVINIPAARTMYVVQPVVRVVDGADGAAVSRLLAQAIRLNFRTSQFDTSTRSFVIERSVRDEYGARREAARREKLLEESDASMRRALSRQWAQRGALSLERTVRITGIIADGTLTANAVVVGCARDALGNQCDTSPRLLREELEAFNAIVAAAQGRPQPADTIDDAFSAPVVDQL